jgi:ribonuclease P protein subunit RPR2
VCRGCDTLLVEGVSCATAVENPSRGGRKPWAALLVRTCGTCGRAKRYPLAGRQETRGRVPRDSREGGQEEEEKKKENTRGANVKTGAVG